MNEDAIADLSVSIRDLQPVHVACLDYWPKAELGNMHEEIHACFERLQAWIRSLGLDPSSLLHIGIPALHDGQLLRYECCVQIPANLQVGPEDIRVRDLPGGRYAVLGMRKDPAVIGNSIGRFYQEYIPRNQLNLDSERPTYEVYYETRMEYCVALL